MPVLMQLYLIGFGIMLFLNLVYWVRFKAKFSMIIYEMLSGGFMIFMILAYWNQLIRSYLNAYLIIGFVAIIAFDFYFTVYGSEKDIGFKLPEISTAEWDIAKAMSVLFAAPAYITGVMLSIDLVR